MRYNLIAMVTLLASFIVAAEGRAQVSGKGGETAAEPPILSGIYGFSGGRTPGADYPEGVVGECIWIFDEANKNQVAKGDCSERNPGKFRVVLKPGRYVVRGPGGNKPVEVKAGQWINIESITLLPGAP
jgi:hypothetical protein